MPSTSAFICCRLPASPWRKTIAGQPPAGGVPSGTYSVAAIETPSSIGIDTSCLAAVDPVASPETRTSAAAIATNQTFSTRRKGTGNRNGS